MQSASGSDKAPIREDRRLARVALKFFFFLVFFLFSLDKPALTSSDSGSSDSELEEKKPARRSVGRPRKFKTAADEQKAILERHLRQAKERAAAEFARRRDPIKKAQRRIKALKLSVERAKSRVVSKQKELMEAEEELASLKINEQ